MCRWRMVGRRSWECDAAQECHCGGGEGGDGGGAEDGKGDEATTRLRARQAGSSCLSDHVRTISPMLASPRCGAKTRTGGACRSPAVCGKKRCRMHGGAAGSGAPKGNENARKLGLFTKDMIAKRRQIQE